MNGSPGDAARRDGVFVSKLRRFLLPGGLIVVGGFLAFACSVILIALVDTATGAASARESLAYRLVIGAYWLGVLGSGLVAGLITRRLNTALSVSAAPIWIGAVVMWAILFRVGSAP